MAPYLIHNRSCATHLVGLFVIAGLMALAPNCFAGTCDKQPSPSVTLALTKASKAIEEKRPEEALATLAKASKRAGERSHHILEFHLGVQLVQAEQPEQAIAHFRRATALCDTYAPAWQNLGRVAYETKHYGEAADALGRAFVLTGETRPNLRYFEALARYRDESWQPCVALCLDLFSRFPDCRNAEWAELAASAASPAKKRPQVIDALTTQIPRMGEKPKFRRSLANLLLLEKRYPEAMVQLRNLDHLGAINDAELMTLGDLFRTENLPLDAADCYRRLADKGKNTAELTRKQAESLMAGFKPKEARSVLEQGVTAWNTERLWLLTGQLRFEAGELSGAEEAFRRVLDLTPDQGHALMMLGYVLFQQEKPEEALPWLNKAVKRAPRCQAKRLRDHVVRLLAERNKDKSVAPAARG
ncbi:tetratricopeptide repeat protein [Desulfoluna spongiiphila]|uniref:Tetratricopeptide repeat-containing protein n=1 Tax=Desulfoluna spongiiphila TaxID=419481 RepID=A0A1G5H8L0_9BACT|nr:tetratricopeptide repeat protein [Desulfoluna spongiiphila]SCY60126.1 Tetratricopeptide repeat-containing protein [Desulfoluna spongiiphila]